MANMSYASKPMTYAPNMSTNKGPVYTPPPVYKAPAPAPVYRASTPQVQQSQPQAQPQSDPRQDAINSQTDAFNQQIDDDYQSTLGQINTQEANLNAQGATATAAVNDQAQSYRNAFNDQSATALNNLTTEGEQIGQQKKTAIQESRDLFRETQQQNSRYLSAAGLSSSSVAAALAEKLGVATARRIAGISDSADSLYRNIEQERSNVTNYAAQKMTEIEKEVQGQIAQIQSSLVQGLNQLNASRQTAASEKAKGRSALLTQAQTAVANLQYDAQKFAQSLQMWKEQNTQKLSTALSTDYSQMYGNTLTQMNQQAAQYPGMQFSTTQNLPGGGKITASTKNKTDDEEETLFK